MIIFAAVSYTHLGLALGISPEEMGMPKRHLTDTAAVTKFVG